MKKLLSVLVAICMLASLTACGKSTSVEETEPPRVSYELAIVMGNGDLEDGKANEAVWSGIKKYSEENSILYKSFNAPDNSTLELFAKIEAAIADGARFVACVGEEQGEAVYYAAQSYPEVHFVIYDGEPRNNENEFKIGKNAMAVFYDGETAGLIKKNIDEQGSNSGILTKLTDFTYNIIKKHYNGGFEGGSKQSLQ